MQNYSQTVFADKALKDALRYSHDMVPNQKAAVTKTLQMANRNQSVNSDLSKILICCYSHAYFL